MRGSLPPAVLNLSGPSQAEPQLQTDAEVIFSRSFSWGSFYTAVFAEMFVCRNLSHRVIAASGIGPGFSRAPSSLQKRLLSQRRDSRLNNHFPITVTIWEQLFACEGLPAIVRDALKDKREGKNGGIEEGKDERKVSSCLIQSSQRVLILISPTDRQMYSMCRDTWTNTYTRVYMSRGTHWHALNWG